MKKISLLVLLFVFFITLTACDKETLKSSEFVDYSKQFTLDRDYENKSFFKDGIGKVEVVQFVDGDTTVFKDISLPASEQANYPEWSSFRVRFLGVDTPETYMDPAEDFGIEAKNFTNTLLTNAKTIVLDSLSDKPIKDSYDSRYLGMVWVDGISINIELIQNGYSSFTSISNLDESKTILFSKAWAQAREYDLNVHSL